MGEIQVNPNWVAYLALLMWPAVTVVLYAKLPIGRATLWAILGAYLLLPVGTQIKFDMVPAFNKSTIPNLTALICCVFCMGRMPRFFRGLGLAESLFLALLVCHFITSVLNGDPIRSGDTYIPGVDWYDGLSTIVGDFIFILPFFLGRQYLRSTGDTTEILRVLAVAGLAYSIPILFEIRISPQLHQWIYGYFPHVWDEQERDGGFRAVVFLGHGLLTSFFCMTATVAAAALWRTRTPVFKWQPAWITAYLGVVLVLCKSVGALLYAIVAVPLVRWANPRLQIRVGVILAVITLTYPMLRVADLVPTGALLELADNISPERAASLKVRFDNENELLQHTWERPWFGWGRYGRERVYTGWRGRDNTIEDGHWIGVLGSFGLLGFAAEFGLLALAIFRAAKALDLCPTLQERDHLAALSLILAFGMIDLLPNSSISPWSWLLTGALLGRAEALRAAAYDRGQVGPWPAPGIEDTELGVLIRPEVGRGETRPAFSAGTNSTQGRMRASIEKRP